MQKQSVLNSPRLSELKKRRRKVFFYKIFLFFFFTFLFFFFLVFLFRLDNLNISEIKISGNKIIDTEILKMDVTEQISGKYFYFFPKTNVLFFPENSIKSELENKFKNLKDVNLVIRENRILEVSVAEREALYTWCGLSAPLSNDNNNQKCYFMDADGYIFDKAPFFSGNVYFKFYGNSEALDLESPTGIYFIKDKFAELILLKKSFDDLRLHPNAFWYDSQGEGHFYLGSSETNKRIDFNMDSVFEKIAENLQAAITTEPLKSKIKNNFASLLYIDLRFENKVYYKFSPESVN